MTTSPILVRDLKFIYKAAQIAENNPYRWQHGAVITKGSQGCFERAK
jgi:hypothetical protein